jgi:hypothetical protein
VPHVVEVDASIKLIGGINAPLVVRTTDSTGHVQTQLCKCNDDLRQVGGGARVVSARSVTCTQARACTPAR